MKLKFHHFGYAIKSIENSLEIFNILGFSKVGKLTSDNQRNVKIQFVKKDDITFELIEPIDESSPVFNILQKHGPAPYHFCLVSDDIIDSIKKFRDRGFVLIENIKPAEAINKQNVAFLFHREIGILELLEG